MGEGTGPLKKSNLTTPPHVACLFSLKFVVEMEMEREQMHICLFTSVKSSWVLKDGGGDKYHHTLLDLQSLKWWFLSVEQFGDLRLAFSRGILDKK